jgi:mercuric ion transport protein
VQVGKIVFSAVGSVSAAFMSMLCCSGPLFLAAAGLSGAGLAAAFRPFRPLFIAGMAVSLWLGFMLLDQEDRACETGKPCANPKSRRRMRTMLVLATVVSFVFATSPIWAPWVV